MKKINRTLVICTVLLMCIALAGMGLAKPNTSALKTCSDGIDNDGDGYTDLDDPGCINKNDMSELDPYVECDDGIDNDGDGYADSSDSGCSDPTDSDESNCGDGMCEGGETQATCPVDCGYPDSCADSDGGIYYDVFGTVSGYYENTPYSNDDFCSNDEMIMEFYCIGDYMLIENVSCGTDYYSAEYCSGSAVYRDFTNYFCASGVCGSTTTPELIESCEYGCTDGECDPILYSCSDSDGGIYGYVYGMIYGYYYGYYYEIYDRCSNENTVAEFYCNGTDKDVINVSCEYGCTDGVCNPIPDSCADTDGGMTEDVFGTVTGYYNEYYYSNDDFCANDEMVVEFYCNGDHKQIANVSCGTDSYSAEYCSGSAVYRDFTDYYCASGACGSTTTPEFVESCEYGCTDGECDPIQFSCNDTDGGINEDVYGIVYGYNYGFYYEAHDFCWDENTLSELYCDGIYRAPYNITCAYGCSNGVCNPIPDSCTDTDGGWNLFEKGTVSGYIYEIPFSYTDYCNSTDVLVEYYCSGSVCDSYPVYLPTNDTMECYDGAIIYV